MDDTANNKTVAAASVWGPHYWFFLHTMAFHYPTDPNTAAKKEVYRLIESFSIFMPAFKDVWAAALADIPVAGYLDNRDNLVQWTLLVHNWVNRRLQKPIWTKSQMIDHYNVVFHTHKKPRWMPRFTLGTWILLFAIGVVFVLQLTLNRCV